MFQARSLVVLTLKVLQHLNLSFVIPAKAGIHHLNSNFTQVGLILTGQVMDSRLRGNDEVYVFLYINT